MAENKNCNDLIGMNINDANKYIFNYNVYYNDINIREIREINIDGESLIISDDGFIDRINVQIKNSIITKIYYNS